MDARELEVRCSGCGAGFAIGTRTCVHCGRALGARSSPDVLLTPGTGTDSGAEEASDENARLSSLLSGGVMLAVVLASALIRACSS